MATINFDSFQNVIDGKLSPTEKTTHNINPSTEEPNPEHPLSTKEDVDRAVAAARRAFDKWRLVPWEERAKKIVAFAQAMSEHTDDLATLITMEMGMPTSVAKFDVSWGVDRLQLVSKIPFELETEEKFDDKTVVTQYAPLGVAVGILPWNFPAHVAVTKIGPAILTGNCIIIKTSPHAPYTPIKLCEIAQQFFPPGVVQCLSGDEELGPWLTHHPDVNKISFTGSIETGKKVMAAASGTLKRITLELGGNDPAIVFPDADLTKAIVLLAQVSLANTGQICTAVKRVYVHESIYDTVLQGFIGVLPHLKVADPLAEGAVLGPAANEMQYNKVKDLLADIEAKKLSIAAKGETPSTGKGFFIAPTIVDNPPDDSRVVTEEAFGPVLPFMKWSDEEDVIKRANATTFGLGASVWTQDKETMLRVGRKLEAGSVWINSHALIDARIGFGGHKLSGIGHEMGPKGLAGYCSMKLISIPHETPGPLPL